MNDLVPIEQSETERRSLEEVERDRVLISRMYVRGKSQHEMARILNEHYPDNRINNRTVMKSEEAQ